MNPRLLRRVAVLVALLVCVAGGLLVGTLSKSPLAGLLCAGALGPGAMILSESFKGNRLLVWLRAGAEGPAPREVASSASSTNNSG